MTITEFESSWDLTTTVEFGYLWHSLTTVELEPQNDKYEYMTATEFKASLD